jgi:hypothetical protein
MAMQKLRHNKKRNLGLVYEFLTREVSSALVAEDRPRAARAMEIIARHLSPGTPLHEELSLHRQVMEARGLSERMAKRIIDELKAAGIRLAATASRREAAKSALIHEMNKRFGKEIFDRYRIAEYTAHASVNILMSRGVDSRLDETVEAAKVEEHLLEFLTSKPTDPVKFDREASLYAYRTAVGLFEQEYGKELTQPQSDLLREYVRVSLGGNPAPFKRTFEKQKNELREVLRFRRSDEVFKTDAEMAARLDEALAGLDALDASKEESVEQLMLYHNLRKEIES